MELTLTRQSETQVTVTCDNQSSHSFDLHPRLLKNEKDEEELLNDPVTYIELEGVDHFDMIDPQSNAWTITIKELQKLVS